MSNPLRALSTVFRPSSRALPPGGTWHRTHSTTTAKASSSNSFHSRPTQSSESPHVEERSHDAKSALLKEQLRSVLRDLPQPVAVITGFMPPGAYRNFNAKGKEKETSWGGAGGAAYHGATLSSFTSIAMDPYPLVAFSLRIPSRMASALALAASSSNQSSSHSTPSGSHAHMVINLLSSAQSSIAVNFSRPDIYPTPFSSVRHTFSQEGIPILDGVSSAISCRLVGKSIPLHDLEHLSGQLEERRNVEALGLGHGEVASELFIARVIRVEQGPTNSDTGLEGSLPLIYHRRGYTTTCQRSRKDS